MLIWLVVPTPLQNMSQTGNLPQVGVEIKKYLSCHHLVIFRAVKTHKNSQRAQFSSAGHVFMLRSSPIHLSHPSHEHLETPGRSKTCRLKVKGFCPQLASSHRKMVCPRYPNTCWVPGSWRHTPETWHKTPFSSVFGCLGTIFSWSSQNKTSGDINSLFLLLITFCYTVVAKQRNSATEKTSPPVDVRELLWMLDVCPPFQNSPYHLQPK